MLDYYEIGLRIRNIRKTQGLSQEELAEKIGISTTHMSHIETGNTKLSLAVLTDIATALCVSTDRLLFSAESGRHNAILEIERILADCTDKQTDIITDLIRQIKSTLDKYQ